MSKLVYEITAVVGKYTNQTGEQKNRYQRIGSIIDTKNGLMMKLDQMPVFEGGWSGWAYLNAPTQKENPKYQGLPKDDSDDIPF
jgi:hypothetical protein